MAENPNCEKTFASICLYGCEPEVLTKILKIEPTDSGKKGDLRGKKIQVKNKINFWIFSSDGKVDSKTDLDLHIQWLLNKFKARVCDLPIEKGYVDCYWSRKTGQGGPVFEWKTLHELVEKGLSLSLDIY